MKVLTRQEILDAADLSTRVVHVDEWNGDVSLKTMTGTERDAFEASIFEGKGKNRDTNTKNLRAKLLSRCIVDDEGKRIFSDKDIDALGSKSARALDQLYSAATELNGIGQKDEEELIKNSESEEAGSSTSPSLGN